MDSPENPLVGALGGLPEALLAVPLVVLLLGDLLNLTTILRQSDQKTLHVHLRERERERELDR